MSLVLHRMARRDGYCVRAVAQVGHGVVDPDAPRGLCHGQQEGKAGAGCLTIMKNEDKSVYFWQT